jgi:hypothetical protein
MLHPPITDPIAVPFRSTAGRRARGMMFAQGASAARAVFVLVGG